MENTPSPFRFLIIDDSDPAIRYEHDFVPGFVTEPPSNNLEGPTMYGTGHSVQEFVERTGSGRLSYNFTGQSGPSQQQP